MQYKRRFPIEQNQHYKSSFKIGGDDVQPTIKYNTERSYISKQIIHPATETSPQTTEEADMNRRQKESKYIDQIALAKRLRNNALLEKQKIENQRKDHYLRTWLEESNRVEYDHIKYQLAREKANRLEELMLKQYQPIKEGKVAKAGNMDVHDCGCDELELKKAKQEWYKAQLNEQIMSSSNGKSNHYYGSKGLFKYDKGSCQSQIRSLGYQLEKANECIDKVSSVLVHNSPIKNGGMNVLKCV